MSLKLNDKELNALLDEVVVDLNKSFSSVKNKLSKAEPEEMAKDDKVPEASEESSPVAKPGIEAPPEASESAEPAPEAPPAPAPEMQAPGQDPAQEMGGELTPEALQAEYEKLPPEELQMHMQACQMALQKLAGGMAPPSPEMAPPPPPPPPPAPMGAMKSEKKAEVEMTLSKSEELAKAEVASLKEDVEILAKTLKAMLETPVRKAITSIAELSKNEEEEGPVSYSPTEMWAKIKEVAKRPDLKKSDKQLIKDLYDRRVEPAVAAKHLAKLFAEE